ncbi:MAG: NAD(P)H-hydrate dehydratase [Candidatus Omnitrophica bacterium]|nr:NAD(P)H-hydrate dehydratase [Candidatus Omnitrophota bacterium]
MLYRKADSHKGDFGHILILAGSAKFSGAAVLSAEAAMCTGAGLVTLGIPASLNTAIIRIKPKEVMTLPLPETREGTLSALAYARIKEFTGHTDIVLIGPGLSQHRSTQGLARKVIKSIDLPMIIDADGLNALSGHLGILKKKNNLILTPHPGEMARLLNTRIETVQKSRNTIAKQFASRYNLTIILKGHHSIVADRKNSYINKTGNPGMSTAGSGDVLAGMLAALSAQGLDDFTAAKYAVYLHGLAGDLAARAKTQMAMIASDIIVEIPRAIKLSS